MLGPVPLIKFSQLLDNIVVVKVVFNLEVASVFPAEIDPLADLDSRRVALNGLDEGRHLLRDDCRTFNAALYLDDPLIV